MMTIAAIAAPKTNGTPPETPTELPDHQQKAVEAGLATYQSVIAQRDALDAKLREATLKIDGMVVQLDALRSVVNMMESSYSSTKIEMEQRVLGHQTQRDDAVARAASLEAVLASIYVMLRHTISEPEAAA